MNKDLIKAVAVTAELTGTDLSETAADVMCQDLSVYPLEQVLGALTRCRKELRYKLTTADVISRLEDGRPMVEQAWAMIPQNEDDSVVWTTEMAEAYGAATPLLKSGDAIAARMAFKQVYEHACQIARDEGTPVVWNPSFGFDKTGREDAVIEAVKLGRLTYERAVGLIPYSTRLHGDEPQLESLNKIKQIVATAGKLGYD